MLCGSKKRLAFNHKHVSSVHYNPTARHAQVRRYLYIKCSSGQVGTAGLGDWQATLAIAGPAVRPHARGFWEIPPAAPHRVPRQVAAFRHTGRAFRTSRQEDELSSSQNAV